LTGCRDQDEATVGRFSNATIHFEIKETPMQGLGSKKGFTLIEVIVAISILVILAGIAIPVVSKQIDKAKVSKILSLVETLRTACDTYHADTGLWSTEYSGAAYASSNFHTLSMEQASTGWDGPYIDHPLGTGDNPFGGNCYLYPNLTGGGIRPNGFDLLGTGTESHTGNGNFIGFGGISQDVAEGVDAAMDSGVAGSWASTGRVEYAGTSLSIYLCGGN